MRAPRSLLLLALVCQGLGAQTAFTTRMQGPEPTLERLLRAVRTQRVGTLVVLDGDGAFAPRVRTLLAQEPLVELAVPVQVLAPDKGAGKELRERQGWNEASRWALLDATGAVRLEGTELPGPQAFAEQLLGAGFIDRGRELEAFLRKREDSVEALDRALAHGFQVAQARMRPLFKKPEPPLGTQEGRPRTSAGPELSRALTDTEDRQIWGTSAGYLDRLLRKDGWQLAMRPQQGFLGGLMALPMEVRFSPLMQDVCRRHLDAVEQVLLRAPSSEGYWRLWVAMAGAAGNRGMRELLDRVVQAPGRKEAPLPPGAVMADFVRECRQAKDWSALQKTLQPRFDLLKERAGVGMNLASMGLSIPGFSSMFMGWDDTVDPLLEALLMQGNAARAEAVVQEMLTWKAAEGVSAKASEVALRCGQEDLAKRWLALGTK